MLQIKLCDGIWVCGMQSDAGLRKPHQGDKEHTVAGFKG